MARIRGGRPGRPTGGGATRGPSRTTGGGLSNAPSMSIPEPSFNLQAGGPGGFFQGEPQTRQTSAMGYPSSSYIWKPSTVNSWKGGIAFLAPDSTDRSQNPYITDSSGKRYDSKYINTNEGRHQWTFDSSLIGMNDLTVNFGGQTSKIGSGAQSYEGNDLGAWQPRDKGSYGDMSGMFGGMGGMPGGMMPGAFGFGAFPGYLGGMFPNPTFANFESIKNEPDVGYNPINAAPYEYVDPIDFATKWGDVSRNQMSKNADNARDIALHQIDTELMGLQRFVPGASDLKRSQIGIDNTFNQAERERMVGAALPDARRQMAEQAARAEAFASGRAPDSITDRALELGIRSAAADRASGGGFGASSSVARKASDLMSAQQRIGLSQYGDQLLSSNINQSAGLFMAPTSYSDVGAQIRATPEVGGARLQAGALSEQNAYAMMNAGQAFSGQVQQNQFGTQLQQQTNMFNTGNQMAIDQFNTSNRLGVKQFNASGNFNESQFNAGVANQFAMSEFGYNVGYAGSLAGAAQTDMNTQLGLAQQQAYQTAFQDSMGQAQAAGQTGAIAQGIASIPGVISGIGGAISSIGGLLGLTSESSGGGGGGDYSVGGGSGGGGGGVSGVPSGYTGVATGSSGGVISVPNSEYYGGASGGYSGGGGGGGPIVVPSGSAPPSGYTGVASSSGGGVVAVPDSTIGSSMAGFSAATGIDLRTSGASRSASAAGRSSGGGSSAGGETGGSGNGGGAGGGESASISGGTQVSTAGKDATTRSTAAATGGDLSEAATTQASQSEKATRSNEAVAKSAFSQGMTALSNAGIYNTQQPGSQYIGVDRAGNSVFGNSELMKNPETTPGPQMVNVLKETLDPFGTFDGENATAIDQVATVAGSAEFLTQLSAFQRNGDTKGFINTLLGRLGQPVATNLADNPQDAAGVGGAFTAYSLYNNWDRMSPAQKALGVATLGIQGYQFADGQNLAEKMIVTPSAPGEIGMSVGQALGLFSVGVNAYGLVKSWDQLDTLQKVAYGTGDLASMANLAKDMNLLGAGTQAAAVPGITAQGLSAAGWAPASQYGIGAIAGGAGAEVPAGFTSVMSATDGSVIAVPASTAESAAGATAGSLLGTAAGVAGVAAGAYNVYQAWGEGGKTGAIQGGLGGAAMAAGLYALGATNPFVLGGVVAASLFGGAFKTGKSEEQQGRDAVRSNFQKIGLIDDDYQLTLASGMKFDIGIDGGGGKHTVADSSKLTAEHQKSGIDGENKLHSYDVDYTNDLDYVASMGGNTLSRLLSGGKNQQIGQLGGQIGNGALGDVGYGQQFTQGNYQKVTANLRAFYAQSGIKSKADAFQLINQGYAEGRWNESDAVSMQQSANIIFDANGYSTASKLMAGRHRGIEVASKEADKPPAKVPPVRMPGAGAAPRGPDSYVPGKNMTQQRPFHTDLNPAEGSGIARRPRMASTTKNLSKEAIRDINRRRFAAQQAAEMAGPEVAELAPGGVAA